MTNIWHHWAGIDEEVAAIFDPFGNAVHTALAFEVHGEDVLISGAGPIGLMAIGVVRHAGARHVVVSEPNAFRRELAERMGATVAVDPDASATSMTSSASWAWSRASTSRSRCPATPSRCDARSTNMAHGGRIAQLGHPDRRDHARRQRDRLQPADAPRHLRPRDVRDLVPVGGPGQRRPRHHAGDHPPVRLPRVRGRLRRGEVRRLRARSSWTGSNDDHGPPQPARLHRRRDRRPQGEAPLPAAAGHERRPGPGHRRRRARGHLPVLERLPRADPPPAAARRGARAPSASTASAPARSGRSPAR